VPPPAGRAPSRRGLPATWRSTLGRCVSSQGWVCTREGGPNSALRVLQTVGTLSARAEADARDAWLQQQAAQQNVQATQQSVQTFVVPSPPPPPMPPPGPRPERSRHDEVTRPGSGATATAVRKSMESDRSLRTDDPPQERAPNRGRR